MPTVITRTIGGTSPDHATIAAFNTAVQAANGGDGDLVSADEQWIGHLRDVTFDEDELDIGAGCTTDATRNIILRAENSMARTGSGYDTTDGSGPAIDPTGVAPGSSSYIIRASADYTVFEDFEVTESYSSGTAARGVEWNPAVDGVKFRRLNIHGDTLLGRGIFATAGANANSLDVVRCKIRDINGHGVLMALSSATSGAVFRFLNNTIHNCSDDGFSGGSSSNAGTTLNFQNNIATDSTNADYDVADNGGGGITWQYNLSSDDTSDDRGATGAVTGATSGNLYISATDLRLDTTASDAIDAGNDLGGSIADVHIDADGYDLDAGGVSWDIGYDQEGLDATDNVTAPADAVLAEMGFVHTAGGLLPWL